MFKRIKQFFAKTKEISNKCPYCGSSNIKEEFMYTNNKTPAITNFHLRFRLHYPAFICKCEDCTKEWFK